MLKRALVQDMANLNMVVKQIATYGPGKIVQGMHLSKL